MTARGDLYIDGDCRDTFEKELDKWFGKENWALDGSPFGNYWDMSEFPKIVEVNVLDDGDGETIIGKVEIESDFFVEEGMGGRYVEIEPKSIRLLWIKDELRELIQEKLENIKGKN